MAIRNVTHSSGFTLIELVITILILSILAVSLIPKIVNFSKDAHIAMVQSETKAFESAIDIARYKWRLLGSPTAKDERDNVQLSGTGISGQIDYNIQGWPAQSYAGSDSVLTNDGRADCLSVYTALIDDGSNKASLNDQTTFQVTKSGQCTYTLVEDPSLGFLYNPINGEVTFFGA